MGKGTPMNPHAQQLLTYVKQHLDQGVSEDHIRAALVQANWNPEHIAEAFRQARASNLPQPPAPPTDAHHPHSPDQHEPTAQVPNEAPEKYKVFRALGDFAQALRHQWGTFILLVLAGYFVCVAILFMLVAGLLELWDSSLNTWISAVLTLVLMTLWYTFAYSLLMMLLAIPVADGAHGHKRGFGATFALAGKHLARVAGANMLLSVIAGWPLIIAIGVPFYLILTSDTIGPGALLFMPILLLVAIIWIIVIVSLYALTPYVALFEPDVPLTKTLRRSRQLLSKGGRWFLFKFSILNLLVIIALAVATGQTVQEISNSTNIGINLFLTVQSIIAGGVIVMLYLNRKAVKG